MKNENILSVREAAKRLKCTIKYIYDLLYSGRLGAHKVAGRWAIPTSEVEARRKARGE